MRRFWRPCLLFGLAGLLAPAWAGGARAQSPAGTLVLPFRSVGASDTTLLVTRDLLEGSLQDLGLPTIPLASLSAPPAAGPAGCDDPECAASFARASGAARVVYGSVSRLGDKFIVRVNVLRAGEAQPHYRDQLTATTEEDLDRVMRRFAEGIAAGRPNSDRATIDSVIREETRAPARRAFHHGLGVRAGFLFPTAGGYGGRQRLTDLRLAYRYEAPSFQIESTSLLGFTWGGGNIDWTLLDVAAARVFGTGDLAFFLGAGGGVHSVRVQREFRRTEDGPYGPYLVYESREQSETAPSADLLAGLMIFRTYDFKVLLELRYHHVFEKFEKVDGDGAQGFRLTLGTNR